MPPADATVRSSDLRAPRHPSGDVVVPVGPDTYRVTSHDNRGEYTGGWASSGEQLVRIYEDATAYCKRQGKAAAMVGQRQVDMGWGKLASVEVEFRCVAR